MKHRNQNGAQVLCSVLTDLGIEVVFGIPGSESIGLFDALRRSSLRTVLTVDERSAALMANGYYRASGKVAAVVVIAGPGFTNTLTGLAEARDDSVGLLCLVVGSDRLPGKKFRLHDLDQKNIAGPVVKSIRQVTNAAGLVPELTKAYREATTGEPGPILVEVSEKILATAGHVPPNFTPPDLDSPVQPGEEQLAAVGELISTAGRVVMYVGQGAQAAADDVQQLAEQLNSPVMTTGSGRGIIPENHPLSFYFDYSRGLGGETINQLIEECDLVLALGCKFTHNGTGGWRLKIPRDKLIHVDASAAVLEANYPTRLAIQADVPNFLLSLIKRLNPPTGTTPGWTPEELTSWRERLQIEKEETRGIEPLLATDPPQECAVFFDTLRRVLPDEAIVVTDCGRHQLLTRYHYEVRSPRGLINPTDFQTMGYGLPAAIGAKLAAPERPVVALVGDGGFAMSAMELTTAVRERIPLDIFVFADARLGLTRDMQLEYSGLEHAVELYNPDYAQFAGSLGVAYINWSDMVADDLQPSADAPVRLIEIPLVDSPALGKIRQGAKVRAAVRDTLGPQLTERLKRWLRR